MLSDCCTVCLTVCDVGVLWPNSWMIKMKVGMEVDHGIGYIVLDGDPALPPRKGAQQPPTFRPMSIVAKWWPISALVFIVIDLLTSKTADGRDYGITSGTRKCFVDQIAV